MFNDNATFYPTPKDLAAKMLSLIDMSRVKDILEPSAGKGDLVDVLRKSFYKFEKGRDYGTSIDCIEQDERLINLLKGKDERVVFDDFLQYNTYKRYDLVVMNPPFDDGDKHLLKAIDLMVYGGQIVCLLNAETLRNPYSNTRKYLARQLERYDAKVTYVENAFLNAERKTGVDVAIVYIDIPNRKSDSLIIDYLTKPEETGIDFTQGSQITFWDKIKRIVAQYQYEAQMGIKLISEYCNVQPFILNTFEKDRFPKPLLELRVGDEEVSNCNQAVNAYLKGLRYKYWYALGKDEAMQSKFTSNLKKLYFDTIKDLQHKEFCVHNIELVNAELMKLMNKATEDTIFDMFEKLSFQHTYNDEYSSNIHYFNGWKTNKAHYINGKVIVPLLNCYDYCFKEIRMTEWKIIETLSDIEKVFDYLNGEKFGFASVRTVLESAKNMGQTRGIRFKYFTADFFKKGTVHIKFRYPELLKKLNIFGSQRKGWLPPTYGKKHYQDMDDEERAVVNAFDGDEAAYEMVVTNADFFLESNTNLLSLNKGDCDE